MKKTFSIILAALLLAATLGTGAAANLIVDHSLQFQLPVVVAIDAVFSGDVLVDDQFQPLFTTENVQVTVHFQDGTYETLSRFFDQASDWWWGIEFEVDLDAELVTVFYQDSNSLPRFMEENEQCHCSLDLDGFFAWLPNTSFFFPGNYLDDILAEFPALLLDQSVMFTSGELYTFTPENTGIHHFFTSGDHDLAIFNTNMELLWWGEIFNTHWWAQVHLTAGETYLVQIWAWGGLQNLTVSETAPAPGSSGGGGSAGSWLQNLVSNLLWSLQHTPTGRLITVLLFPIMLPLLGLLRLTNWIYTGRW